MVCLVAGSTSPSLHGPQLEESRRRKDVPFLWLRSRTSRRVYSVSLGVVSDSYVVDRSTGVPSLPFKSSVVRHSVLLWGPVEHLHRPRRVSQRVFLPSTKVLGFCRPILRQLVPCSWTAGRLQRSSVGFRSCSSPREKWGLGFPTHQRRVAKDTVDVIETLVRPSLPHKPLWGNENRIKKQENVKNRFNLKNLGFHNNLKESNPTNLVLFLNSKRSRGSLTPFPCRFFPECQILLISTSMDWTRVLWKSTLSLGYWRWSYLSVLWLLSRTCVGSVQGPYQ